MFCYGCKNDMIRRGRNFKGFGGKERKGRDETRSFICLPFIGFQQEQLWYWKAAQAFKEK